MTYDPKNRNKKAIDDTDGSWDAHECYVEKCEWCGKEPEHCQCDDNW